LLVGLPNKNNTFASTVDKQDINAMLNRNATGELNLLENHIFQFDFLNDGFDKLPKVLKDIIDDENERKKLIIFMNPPYAEVSSMGIRGKAGVNQTEIHKNYTNILGTAGRELFAQFLIRIYNEIPDCNIGYFSKLKTINSPAFKAFRNNFNAKFLKGFLCPS
jgi:hypothetical protein